MCTISKNKKVDFFCYVLNSITSCDVIQETKVKNCGIIYLNVKCKCGDIHPAVITEGKNYD